MIFWLATSPASTLRPYHLLLYPSRLDITCCAGVTYPLEAHMVTFIPNTTLSTCPPGGCLVVFGVFYKYGSDNTTNTFLQQLNPALQSRGAVRPLSSFRGYCMFGLWFAPLHLGCLYRGAILDVYNTFRPRDALTTKAFTWYRNGQRDNHHLRDRFRSLCNIGYSDGSTAWASLLYICVSQV
jgi:hypothetical protein